MKSEKIKKHKVLSEEEGKFTHVEVLGDSWGT